MGCDNEIIENAIMVTIPATSIRADRNIKAGILAIKQHLLAVMWMNCKIYKSIR